jgi:hypothetical protein
VTTSHVFQTWEDGGAFQFAIPPPSGFEGSPNSMPFTMDPRQIMCAETLNTPASFTRRFDMICAHIARSRLLMWKSDVVEGIEGRSGSRFGSGCGRARPAGGAWPATNAFLNSVSISNTTANSAMDATAQGRAARLLPINRRG